MSEEKNLKSKEICDIISKCSESGVTMFKYGGLEISFEVKKKISEITPFQGHEAESINIEGSIEPDEFIDDRELIDEDAKELRVRQINESLIEDPYLAEQLLSCEDILEDYIDSHAMEGQDNAET